MSKKKQKGKPNKKIYHIFGNKQLNEMFCDSREASIDFYRLSVERFDQWFDNPRLKVTFIGERENKIVAFMAGLMEAAFELGWNEAMKKMKTPSNSLRATLVTPPPCGHPLYKQRGSWEDSESNE